MATNDDDPGFIDDDTPARKPAPDAAPAGGGGVDPFAEGVSADPFAPAPTTPGGAAAADPVPAPDPFAGQSPVAGDSALAAEARAEADADIKPGSRKDLWTCLHCGAKNKPDRDRCRACDKSPDEPVQRAAWKHPGVLAGAAVVVVLLLWLLVGGGGAVQVAATPENLDRALRLAAGGVDSQIGGEAFQAAGRLAFCGRVLQIGENEIDGVPVQRLLLIGGDPAIVLADDWRRRVRVEVDDELEVSIDGRVSWDGTVQPVLLHVLDGSGLAGVEPGELVSCSGSHGRWAAWQPTKDGNRPNEYVIVLDGQVQSASVK